MARLKHILKMKAGTTRQNLMTMPLNMLWTASLTGFRSPVPHRILDASSRASVTPVIAITSAVLFSGLDRGAPSDKASSDVPRRRLE